MKSYEIQTLREGKWAIDSIFNDRDLALFEARRVDENRRYMGVRVIEEVYDEQSGLTTLRTIFRGSKSGVRKNGHRSPPGKRPTVVPPPRGGTGQEPTPKARAHREPEKKKSTLLVPVLLVILVLFLGLAGLFGLQLLSARV